jgi:hypothetical protein
MPQNQGTLEDLQHVYLGLNIPNNLVVRPACSANCPSIIGTVPGSVIVATSTTDTSVYSVGNNILLCGSCKAIASIASL